MEVGRVFMYMHMFELNMNCAKNHAMLKCAGNPSKRLQEQQCEPKPSTGTSDEEQRWRAPVNHRHSTNYIH